MILRYLTMDPLKAQASHCSAETSAVEIKQWLQADAAHNPFVRIQFTYTYFI